MASISPMGVMPAIGSLAKEKLKATAPMILPSMYTGLPLIPWRTPVCSRFRPESRAMMAFRLGPVLARTPRISTSNSSTLFPAKTVRPLPFIPVLTSSRGRISVAERAKPAPRMTARAVAAKTAVFLMF